ncbi:MAG: (d)CMP kinase [Dehalococcoidia bacterium]|jgi:cytidylate kinase
MSKPSTIAIDGPAACGKTTVGRLLAKKLGYRFVDTGAMYRALTWEALRIGVDIEDEYALGGLAARTKMKLPPGRDEGIIVNGRFINSELRSPEVDFGVSPVAKVANVREVLVRNQRLMAKDGNIVMVGRDIGTNVLLDADLKVYLDVSVENQARRRYKEMTERGEKADYEDIFASLVRRDQIDSKRSVNPLRKADDAHVINTDIMDANGVLVEILKLMDGC